MNEITLGKFGEWLAATIQVDPDSIRFSHSGESGSNVSFEWHLPVNASRPFTGPFAGQGGYIRWEDDTYCFDYQIVIPIKLTGAAAELIERRAKDAVAWREAVNGKVAEFDKFDTTVNDAVFAGLKPGDTATIQIAPEYWDWLSKKPAALFSDRRTL